MQWTSFQNIRSAFHKLVDMSDLKDNETNIHLNTELFYIVEDFEQTLH